MPTAEAAETDDERPPAGWRGALARARTVAGESVRTGMLPLLAGGVAVASALRELRRDGTAATRRAGLGAALLLVGARQRRSGGADDPGSPAPGEEATGSEPRTETMRRSTAPGDVDERRAADRAVDLSGADHRSAVRSVSDAAVDLDPRTDGPPEPGEADVSADKLADEAGEATGPEPEQAEPAQSEDTEPDRTPPEDHTTDERLFGSADRDAARGGAGSSRDVADEDLQGAAADANDDEGQHDADDEDSRDVDVENPETGVAGSHPSSETERRELTDDEDGGER